MCATAFSHQHALHKKQGDPSRTKVPRLTSSYRDCKPIASHLLARRCIEWHAGHRASHDADIPRFLAQLAEKLSHQATKWQQDNGESTLNREHVMDPRKRTPCKQDGSGGGGRGAEAMTRKIWARSPISKMERTWVVPWCTVPVAVTPTSKSTEIQWFKS